MEPNQIPIQDFIQSPTTISLTIPYSPLLEQVIAERPYFRMGKVLENIAIVYTSPEYVNELPVILSLNFINTYPHTVGLLGEKDLESIGATAVINNPDWNYTGEGVLLGFVDTGIDYTNDAFRYENGSTRIKYIWDQSIEGTFPDHYFFGSEYTEEALNRALQSSDPLSMVPHQDMVGHGTFLASVAGGHLENQNIGVAPNSEFIVVKLKDASQALRNFYYVPENVENVFTSIDLMLGIQYLIEKAAQLQRPISICLGVGSNVGGHDGLSVLEEYINMVSRKIGVCISSAAGNESQAKHHTSGKFTGENQTRIIEIKTGEKPDSFLMNIVSSSSDRISIGIISPTGEIINRVPPKPITRLETKLILERTTIIIEYVFPVDVSGAQLTVIHFLTPTPGLWKVMLYSDIYVEGTYNAWLPISSLSPTGLEFIDPDPYTTVVIPSTTIGVISCGAYNSANNSLYVNSSWGPTRVSLMAPNLAAPGVNVVGMYPSGLGTMTGTSVASAMTAGAAALVLQWGIVNKNDPFVNTHRIKTFFIQGCLRSESITYPNYQWGYGRLNVYETFWFLTDNE